MKLYLSPQLAEEKSNIKIKGEKIQVDKKLYDFTSFPNGLLKGFANDIISAKRVNGELHIEIINRLDDTATQEELFPEWQTVERDDALDDELTLVEIDWYTDDERASDELIASLQPTQKELADADLEIKMLTLLMEMEVI